MPKTTYVIPCWKNAQLSKKAIESALEQPDSYVIAIDNFSMDGGETLEMFNDLKEKKYPNLKLISSEKNLGWIGGVNLGIEMAPKDSEFICFMNNDVELKKDFSEKLFPHFEEDVGAVSPIGNNVAGLNDYKLKGYPDHHKVKMMIGFCFVVRKSIVDKIGGLDPIFGWGLSDDLDFSLRIRKIGFDLVIARDCRVFHHGSQAIKIKYENEEDYQKDLDKKTKIFLGKWGQDEYNDIMRIEPPCAGTIGVPHLEMVNSEFMHSYTGLSLPPHTQASYVKGSLVMKARNDIAESMKGDWLLFIDSDMTFPKDALERLLAHNLDIVGGLCFRKVPPYNPTIYRKLPGQLKWDWVQNYPRDSLFEVDATGCAFLLIKKKVFDKMPKPWFEYNKNIGEDLFFCHKAKELGFKIHIDSSVKIGHVTTHSVGEEFYDEFIKNKKIVEV